jgi:hypothetical protein
MSPYARRVYVTILLMVTGFAFLSRLTQIALSTAKLWSPLVAKKKSPPGGV